jgi:hypothetical protein
MTNNCIIYSLTSVNYVDLLKFSIRTIRSAGEYHGDIYINVFESIYDDVKDAFDDVHLNKVSLPYICEDDIFYAKYIMPPEKFDCYLYLDADVIAIKPIDEMFEVINNNKTTISSVIEVDRIQINHIHYRYRDNDGNDGAWIGKYGLNGGQFGYTRKCSDILKKILKLRGRRYCENGSFTDQPIFNKVLHETNRFNTELSRHRFVYLHSRYSVSGVKPHPKNILFHFNGPDAGIQDTTNKLAHMKRVYEHRKDEEIT